MLLQGISYKLLFVGIGEHAPDDKVVALPNTPSMCYKLFSVKHLVEIIPLKFPMGFPSDEEFDPAACRINHRGEFYYHPKLKVDTVEPKDQMTIAETAVYKFCESNWYKPWTSPFGNSNYHRDTTKIDPTKWDRATDQAFKVKFKEDLPKFSKYIK